MSTITEENIYIVCPACDSKDSSCGHIHNESSFGPWYCDTCREGYRGKRDEDGIFHVERTYERIHDILIALSFNKIIFLVKGMQFENSEKPLVINDEIHRYHYEENTCPVNFLRVEEVIDLKEMDFDPHGLFKYLGAIPFVDTDSLKRQEDILNKFKEFNIDLKALIMKELNETKCQKPGVASCAKEWEASHQTRALEEYGIEKEFPFGSDAIQHVAESLIIARQRIKKLEEKLSALGHTYED